MGSDHPLQSHCQKIHHFDHTNVLVKEKLLLLWKSTKLVDVLCPQWGASFPAGFLRNILMVEMINPIKLTKAHWDHSSTQFPALNESTVASYPERSLLFSSDCCSSSCQASFAHKSIHHFSSLQFFH